jgi:hypothetical protein
MRARTRISEKLLNEKVMALLHARGSCTDARSVMLELVDDAEIPYNWRIGHFDPGRGDRYKCKVTLREIHESLWRDYEMVGYS